MPPPDRSAPRPGVPRLSLERHNHLPGNHFGVTMTTQPYDFSSALRLLWATLDIDGGELAARFGVSRRALDYWLSLPGDAQNDRSGRLRILPQCHPANDARPIP